MNNKNIKDMETNEENNVQQEIIDSMAKKVTTLEKRQSKIEELDLAALPSKVNELETKVTETAEMRTLENTKQLERFDKQLNGFDEKINAIPKEIPVKYNVQFDTKSKFVIRTILGLGLAVAVMLAISMSLWIENSRRVDETNKFLILRGFYPDVAKYLDSACKGLLLGEAKIAIAGGVSMVTHQQKGYIYQEGFIHSSDGHCRAFDKRADGTVGGEGAGAVVLKRLTEAVNDGDHIYAVIKGSAINNDGNRKVGFTAPSIDGQVDCIRKAQKFSGVDPGSISYIEAHGTGTKLGDPIEVEALNIAFNKNKTKHCTIGSVKTNIGHLDSAAGIAGLIKVALSLKNRQIPASLHFDEPNPKINFDEGPFYVNKQLRDWGEISMSPLRAGVSSFGIGGTNAHMILEEAPKTISNDGGRSYKLLTLSAKSKNSLLAYCERLAKFLSRPQELNLGDMAYTYQLGRQHFTYRKSITYRNREDIIPLLSALKSADLVKSGERKKIVAFMFPGQGSQYANMAKELYLNEPLFRTEMNKGFSLLINLTGEDFKSVLFPQTNGQAKMSDPRYAQPLIFLFEYALSQLIISLGVRPDVMIGHSTGEYVAACISGVFTFEDGIRLIVKRGALMNKLPAGAMISASMSESDAQLYLSTENSLAAVNGPQQVVFSGSIPAVEALKLQLEKQDIFYLPLQASHAYHSHMQLCIMEEFRKELEKVKLNPLQHAFFSNLTGTPMLPGQGTDVEYWVNHLRHTVKFSNGIENMLQQHEDLVAIEVGAGHLLTSLLRQHLKLDSSVISVNLIPSEKESENDIRYFTEKIGQLWEHGIEIDWAIYNRDENRRRVSLPTYAFESTNYQTEVDPFLHLSVSSTGMLGKTKKKFNKWFNRVQWKQSIWLPGKQEACEGKTVALFLNDDSAGINLNTFLNELKINYINIFAGDFFEKKTEGHYIINPDKESDYEALFQNLKANEIKLHSIIHLWGCQSFEETECFDPGLTQLYIKLGYHSLLNVVRNYNTFYLSEPLDIKVVSSGLYDVVGDEIIVPIKSTVLGAVKVIPMEFPNISCTAIDIREYSADKSLAILFKELFYISGDVEIAIRGRKRYVKDFEEIHLDTIEKRQDFKKNGTYLITGAGGGMGQLFADFLVREFQANLILITRELKNTNSPGDETEIFPRTIHIQADISNRESVIAGIAEAEKKLGPISGIIHAAGVGDFAGVILKRQNSDDKKIFDSKITGTQVLASIFKDRHLDFFVSCSSLSASFGSFGQVGYVAANLYQDAFATAGNPHYPVISIEWTFLQDAGMAVNNTSHLTHEEQAKALFYGINSIEAVSVLRNAIFLAIPVQIICTTDLKQSIDSHFSLSKLPEMDINNTHLRQRPDLASGFEEPQTPTEETLKAMFENFFGIDRVGVLDDFFELGGDSLKGMMILRRIKKDFGVDINLKDFFKNGNVRFLASEIDEVQSLINNRTEKANKKMIDI